MFEIPAMLLSSYIFWSIVPLLAMLTICSCSVMFAVNTNSTSFINSFSIQTIALRFNLYQNIIFSFFTHHLSHFCILHTTLLICIHQIYLRIKVTFRCMSKTLTSLTFVCSNKFSGPPSFLVKHWTAPITKISTCVVSALTLVLLEHKIKVYYVLGNSSVS